MKKEKSSFGTRCSTRPKLLLVFKVKSNWECNYSTLDEIIFHHWAIPSLLRSRCLGSSRNALSPPRREHVGRPAQTTAAKETRLPPPYTTPPLNFVGNGTHLSTERQGGVHETMQKLNRLSKHWPFQHATESLVRQANHCLTAKTDSRFL